MSELRKDLPTPLDILAGTRSFRGLDAEALRAFVAAAEPHDVAAGTILFRAGDAYCRCVYVLLSGNMVMRRPTGEEVEIQIGDFLGLANYLDEEPHLSTALAVTSSVVLRVSADRLKALEATQPALFNALNRIIAQKLRIRSPVRSISAGVLAKPVSNVMRSPVVSCGPQITLRQAFEMMRERRVGSLVAVDADQRLLGILTFAGLAEATLLQGAQPHDSIMKAACELARTITPDTPLWRAEELQQQYRAKYLIVVDGETPVGMVSQTDITRVLTSQPSILSAQIPQVESIEELTELARHLPEVASAARDEHRRPSAAVRHLSETHLALQRRAVELTLAWMQEKGHGEAPVPFAVLIMGSGGRREMLLNPDQDNGLILADAPETESDSVQAWFERFSKRLNKNLDRIGYILCPGDIMARNPMFRKSLRHWKDQVRHIAEKPTVKAARWANVVFDFDTLYGDEGLTTELRRHVLSELQARQRLLKMMADEDAEGRPAIGFFNQLVTTTEDEQGKKIDIKRNGLRIIADAARIFALQNGIAVQNTTERMTSLVRVGKLSGDFSASVREAYEELVDLLLSHQLRQARRGKTLDKLVDPASLSEQSRATLRMAMRAVKRFQDRLADDYATDIF